MIIEAVIKCIKTVIKAAVELVVDSWTRDKVGCKSMTDG